MNVSQIRKDSPAQRRERKVNDPMAQIRKVINLILLIEEAIMPAILA